MDWSLLSLIIINGLVDSINPCAITVMLLFIGLVIGSGVNRQLIKWMGSLYIATVYITYLLIGLGLLKVTNLLGMPHLVVQIGAWVAIIFGLWMLKDDYLSTLPWRFTTFCGASKSITKWALEITIPATIVVGFLVAITEFPCSGAIYLATIGLLSIKTTFWQGFLYLLLYNLMFILPLVIIYAFSINQKVSQKLARWQELQGKFGRLILALFMIGLGILIMVIT